MTSSMFGSREDELLGSEACKGGHGDQGEPLRGGGHSCDWYLLVSAAPALNAAFLSS
jgi:hypothetical protein